MRNERRGGKILADGGDSFVTECRPDESITRAVVRSLATVRGVDELDLEPLYRNVDPDALETLVRHSESHTSYVAIEFTMDDYTVLVRGDGSIRIDPNSPRTATDPNV